MAETGDLKHQYAYLRELSLEKLLKLLELASVPASTPEEEAYLNALEAAIIEKEDQENTGLFPDIEQQWQSFRNAVLPDEDDEDEDEGDPAEAYTPADEIVPQNPPKRAWHGRAWRVVLAVAAVLACMLLMMVSAQAAGIDVAGAFAKWTKDVFSFGRIGGPDAEETAPTSTRSVTLPETDYASFQEALDRYGITEIHEPSWLPEDYTLCEMMTMCMEETSLLQITGVYSDGEHLLSVEVAFYEQEPEMHVQKVEGDVDSTEWNGTQYYFIENSVGRTIAWYSEQYEYYISGEEDNDVLWKVMKSLYEQTGTASKCETDRLYIK